ncbi:hypothetical protein [Phenylobacterium sp.]|jgi:hypothetical protein|uniref:hypothetical protein n=1 Tax=Phenylobacterium sp. TaxID=1871053 RepID=UPI002E316718|nr:hypothetical protein [Phenylobacterium sp.]HEX2560380.1 hypothetical protein [Phenylobacterium sp.]
MANENEKAEGSLTDGGSLPGRRDPRTFGGEREKNQTAATPDEDKGARLPGEADLSTQRGKDLPDGGYAAPGEDDADPDGARGYGG